MGGVCVKVGRGEGVLVTIRWNQIRHRWFRPSRRPTMLLQAAALPPFEPKNTYSLTLDHLQEMGGGKFWYHLFSSATEVEQECSNEDDKKAACSSHTADNTTHNGSRVIGRAIIRDACKIVYWMVPRRARCKDWISMLFWKNKADCIHTYAQQLEARSRTASWAMVDEFIIFWIKCKDDLWNVGLLRTACNNSAEDYICTLESPPTITLSPTLSPVSLFLVNLHVWIPST